MHKHQWVVPASYEGKRLSLFLKDKIGDTLSNRQIKAYIEKGLLTVNGKTERFTSRKLQIQDKVELYLDTNSSDRKGKTKADSLKASIVFENSEYAVVNKPPGFECHQDKLKEWIPQLETSFLVHRLDVETSGVMVVAKTVQGKEYFEEQFKSKKVDKVYLALCDTTSKVNEGTIDKRLVKHFAKGFPYIRVTKSDQVGFSALTEWKTQKILSRTSKLIECHPMTGRTHQLRVHLSSSDMPIYGDKRYAQRKYHKPYFPNRCMLHAWKIQFIDPISEKKVDYKVDLPEDFKKALTFLERS